MNTNTSYAPCRLYEMLAGSAPVCVLAAGSAGVGEGVVRAARGIIPQEANHDGDAGTFPVLEASVQANAESQGVTIVDYLLALVEREALITPPAGSENWTLQDALSYAGPLPDDLGTACAVASQTTLNKVWDNAKDDAQWPVS